MTITVGERVAIRPAVEADITEVVLLERETATAPHWPVAEYTAMLRRGSAGGLRRSLYVAADGRSVCGFAVGKAVRVGRDVEAELESVVVNAALRRQGVGSSLCRAIMQWSQDAGAHIILLEVRAGSAGAIHMYGGLGFVASGRRAGYYHDPSEDAIVMRCGLLRRGTGTGSGDADSTPGTEWLDV